MREIRTSGLMSGVWETGRRSRQHPRPTSTLPTLACNVFRNQASRRISTHTQECPRHNTSPLTAKKTAKKKSLQRRTVVVYCAYQDVKRSNSWGKYRIVS